MTANTNRQDAIVQLPEMEGRAVLVYGGLILTAAHCLRGFPTDGGLCLDGHFPVEIETTSGTLTADLAEISLMRDVAVLRSPGDQEAYRQAEAFEKFCEEVTPFRLCTRDFSQGESFPVQVYSREGSWSHGTATRWAFDGSIWVKTDEDVLGGASGGPILTEDGELVGVVSEMGGTGGEDREGVNPHLLWALPRWVIREILLAQGDEEYLRSASEAA